MSELLIQIDRTGDGRTIATINGKVYNLLAGYEHNRADGWFFLAVAGRTSSLVLTAGNRRRWSTGRRCVPLVTNGRCAAITAGSVRDVAGLCDVRRRRWTAECGVSGMH